MRYGIIKNAKITATQRKRLGESQQNTDITGFNDVEQEASPESP